MVSKFATFRYRSPSELRNQNDTRNQYSGLPRRSARMSDLSAARRNGRVSPRAVVPPMHLSTRHGWPDVHVVAVSCVTVSQSGDPKSEPPDVWRCYGASVAPVAPVLPAAAEMFLGARQHGIVGEYPVNLYL